MRILVKRGKKIKIKKKTRSNSFQKGKEIGRNTFELKRCFPKGFS